MAGKLVQGRLEQREHVTFLRICPLNQEGEIVSRHNFCESNSLIFDITRYFTFFSFELVEKKVKDLKDLTARKE